MQCTSHMGLLLSIPFLFAIVIEHPYKDPYAYSFFLISYAKYVYRIVSSQLLESVCLMYISWINVDSSIHRFARNLKVVDSD